MGQVYNFSKTAGRTRQDGTGIKHSRTAGRDMTRWDRYKTLVRRQIGQDKTGQAYNFSKTAGRTRQDGTGIQHSKTAGRARQVGTGIKHIKTAKTGQIAAHTIIITKRRDTANSYWFHADRRTVMTMSMGLSVTCRSASMDRALNLTENHTKCVTL